MPLDISRVASIKNNYVYIRALPGGPDIYNLKLITMNSKNHQRLLVLLFVAAIAGLVLSIYNFYIAERINHPVFLISTVLNLFIVFFLLWLIRREAKKK
jgi:prolipoprotein diacylglyceryltransferase